MAHELIEGDTTPGKVKIGVVVSKWNSMITDKMLSGALKSLKGNGIAEEDITVVRCPGSYEIPLAVQKVVERREVAGVIALGVVIRGGT
ncbi:MAG TPA: 6,7-dimethyl-8-ribityllumazine synthase, partial [Balneolaceae bacterium]|nr:6,7-dimethyl-8-ribityllumazine synthase [Balneolaceae bacterium]